MVPPLVSFTMPEIVLVPLGQQRRGQRPPPSRPRSITNLPKIICPSNAHGREAECVNKSMDVNAETNRDSRSMSEGRS
jgi:hypothetical protein